MGLFLLAAWSLWKNTGPEGSVASWPRYQETSQTAGRRHSPLRVPNVGPQEAVPGCALRSLSSERKGRSSLSSDPLCPKLSFFLPTRSGAAVNFLRVAGSSLGQQLRQSDKLMCS